MSGHPPEQEARSVSRLRFLVGSAALLGYHCAAGAVLEGAALLDGGFKPVARFHRAYLADLVRDLARRGSGGPRPPVEGG